MRECANSEFKKGHVASLDLSFDIGSETDKRATAKPFFHLQEKELETKNCLMFNQWS